MSDIAKIYWDYAASLVLELNPLLEAGFSYSIMNFTDKLLILVNKVQLKS